MYTHKTQAELLKAHSASHTFHRCVCQNGAGLHELDYCYANVPKGQQRTDIRVHTSYTRVENVLALTLTADE